MMRRRQVVVAMVLGMSLWGQPAFAQDAFVPQLGSEVSLGNFHSDLMASITPLFEAADAFGSLAQPSAPGGEFSGAHASVVQYGYHNEATINQSRAAANASITQFGAYNRATVNQN